LRRIILSHNSDDKSRLTRPMLAKPEDYAKATQRIWHTAGGQRDRTAGDFGGEVAGAVDANKYQVGP
jgi:hypothetical protein